MKTLRTNQRAYITRLNVYRYNKSGKAIAYHLPSKGIGVVVLDLTPDLRDISQIRTVRQLRHVNLGPTEFEVEVEMNLLERRNREFEITAEILRVLTYEDTNIARWQDE